MKTLNTLKVSPEWDVSHIHFSPHLNPKSVPVKRTMNKDLGDLNASLGSVTDFAVTQEVISFLWTSVSPAVTKMTPSYSINLS